MSVTRCEGGEAPEDEQQNPGVSDETAGPVIPVPSKISVAVAAAQLSLASDSHSRAHDYQRERECETHQLSGGKTTQKSVFG